MTERTCSKCSVTKPLEEFSKHAKCIGGRTRRCRECDKVDRHRRLANRSEEKKEEDRKRHAAQVLASYHANPDNARKRAKEWRENNPDRVRKLARRWYEENTEYAKARSKRWAKENPELVSTYAGNRRARIKGNGVFVVMNYELERLYSSLCVFCGSDGPIHADHIIPIARGGRHSIGNLQPLCASCNLSKKDKLMVEWRYRSV